MRVGQHERKVEKENVSTTRYHRRVSSGILFPPNGHPATRRGVRGITPDSPSIRRVESGEARGRSSTDGTVRYTFPRFGDFAYVPRVESRT